jgi:hypothetical protein
VQDEHGLALARHPARQHTPVGGRGERRPVHVQNCRAPAGG